MNVSFDDMEVGWPLLLRHVMQNGHVVSPRGKLTFEVVDAGFTLTDPNRAVVHANPARRLNHAFSAAEFCWVAAGDDEVDALAFFNSRMREFADVEPVAPGRSARLFGAYGPPVVAQLPYVLETLREDPDSRQAVVDIWRPSPPRTRDVPCTLSLQFLLRAGRLDLVVTMRSNDIWLGTPYDVPLFCRVQSLVASKLGVELGEYHHRAGSLHLYEGDFAGAREAVKGHHAGLRPDDLVVGPFDAGQDPPSVWLWVKDVIANGYQPRSRWGAGWDKLARLTGEYAARKRARESDTQVGS